MQVIDAVSGKVLHEISEPNKVVTLGHTNTAKLIGGDVSGKKVSKIGFGTNGTAPDLTDTGLTDGYSKAITSFS